MMPKGKGLTRQDIEKGFRDIGVRKGMMLEVHSSLSSFGYVEGGAVTVIEALMRTIGSDGAIVMPTFPMSKPLPLSNIDRQRGLSYKIRIFDEASNEPSGMGVIPDTFRHTAGVLTGKGEHRVSAWGKDAEKNSHGLMNLIENGGYALLIGVDIYRLTSMHYMEGKLPVEVQRTYEAPEELLKYYPRDQWYIQTGRPPDPTERPPVHAWYKIQDEAYRRGLIREKLIGKSKCMFFQVNDVVRIYERAIDKDPFELFGVER
jgi:aminoglycoside N3'-acetyltransferase